MSVHYLSSCIAGYIVFITFHDIFVSEDLFLKSSPFPIKKCIYRFLAPLRPTQFSNPRTATASLTIMCNKLLGLLQRNQFTINYN